MFEIIGIITAVIFLLAVSFAFYYYMRNKSNDDMKFKNLVDQINNVNYYSYEYDKGQEKNIQNLEENITNMHDTLMTVKDAVGAIQNNAVTPSSLKEKIQTNNLTTNKLDLGPLTFKNSTSTPFAAAKGEDWLQLYKGKDVAGGLNIDKLKVNTTADFGGDVDIKRLNVKDDLIFNGQNKWIVHTPDDGRTSMYIAPANKNLWNWEKQFVYDNNGYLSIYGGGLNLRGGYSKHNPDKLATKFPGTDGQNHISGDTQMRGDVNVHGVVKPVRDDPGPMIEKAYGDNTKYGIGQYPNGTMRLYTAAGYGPATLNLSLAKPDGQFDDVIKMRTDKSIDINGYARFNKALQTNEIRFAPTTTDPYSMQKVTNNNKTSLRVTINDSKNDSFEVWGNACAAGNCTGPGKKLATVTATGMFCIGDNMCLKESQGALAVCDAAGAVCKKVQLVGE